jgi:phosphoribosyl 1,2-cyclic phosphate phosphodiesterase
MEPGGIKGNIVILGSGTSMGVPTLGCTCRVCTSTDPRDRRLRPSIAVEWMVDGKEHRVIIDTGPDFREQALRENIRHLDAVLYTHSHADHILGLDDLRPLTFLARNEAGQKIKVPLYADESTAIILERIFDYTFSPDSPYPNKARVDLRRLEQSVDIGGARFVRVPLMHGELEVAGFRFGNAAYLTDMNRIPENSFALLEGVDVVILDALRKTRHPSHANIEEAAEWVRKLHPRVAYFTHMSHDILHAETEQELPAPIHLAYDGLRIPIQL